MEISNSNCVSLVSTCRPFTNTGNCITSAMTCGLSNNKITIEFGNTNILTSNTVIALKLNGVKYAASTAPKLITVSTSMSAEPGTTIASGSNSNTWIAANPTEFQSLSTKSSLFTCLDNSIEFEIKPTVGISRNSRVEITFNPSINLINVGSNQLSEVEIINSVLAGKITADHSANVGFAFIVNNARMRYDEGSVIITIKTYTGTNNDAVHSDSITVRDRKSVV